MMGHSIRFKGVIGNIIPKFSPLPLLIWRTGIVFKLPTLEHLGSVRSSTGSATYWAMNCISWPGDFPFDLEDYLIHEH